MVNKHMSLLETKELTKSFEGFLAVDSVDLSVDSDTVHSLIGPNGAGKTTLFNLITGELKPASGSIVFDGTDITDRAAHDRPYVGISRSYQITNIYPDLSVWENVETAVAMFHSNYLDFLRPLHKRSDIDDRTQSILSQLGLEDEAHTNASVLSYGDQRRLEIGMALASDPKLLLLDEPTAGMDQSESNQTIELIEELSSTLTVLLVEHDVELVLDISDAITVIHQGQHIRTDTPDGIRTDERVRKIYLGSDVNA